MKATVLLTLAALGCAGASDPSTTASPAAPRGRTRTIPTTAKALINASVDVTFRAAVAALADAPLETQLIDADKGVVETAYFDLTQLEWRSENYPVDERQVRIRITVEPDTLGRGSRVAVYALYQPSRQLGMAFGRSVERSVPSDHPGAEFARKLIAKIEEKAIGSGG